MRQFAVAATALFLYGCTSESLFRLPENSQEIHRRYDSRTIRQINSQKALSLKTAQDTALKNNPDYRTAYQAVNAARHRYHESLGAYLPRLDAGAEVSQELNRNSRLIHPPDGIGGGGNSVYSAGTLQSSWLVFDGMAREFSVLIAKSAYAEKAALRRNARRLLVRAVSCAYFDTVLATELEKIALADIEFQESCLRQAESRYRYGLVPLGDVLNFKIRRSMARSRFYEARYRRETANFALTSLMGCPAGTISEAVKLDRMEFDDTELLPDTDMSIDLALQNRPDLQSSRILLQMYTYRKYRGYAPFLPRLEAFAELSLAGHNTYFHQYKVKRSRYVQTAFDYGVTAHWNIFEGFRAWNELKALTADESIASMKLESEFLECISSVQTACANLRNCREQLKLFREMREWVKHQRKLIYSEYQGGLVTITRVNEAQRDLVQAESDFASSMADFGKARAQYQAAICGN